MKLIVAERRTRVDLETINLAVRSYLQINPGKTQPKRLGKRNTTLRYFVRQLGRHEPLLLAFKICVPVIGRGRSDFGCDRLSSNRVHPHVFPRDVLLKLSRASSNRIEPTQ